MGVRGIVSRLEKKVMGVPPLCMMLAVVVIFL